MDVSRRTKTGILAVVTLCCLAAVAAVTAGPWIPAPASQDAVKTTDPIGRLQALQSPDNRTRVLVLGTSHLRQIDKAFQPRMLNRLTDVLEGFRPQAVCIESLPGTRVREYELRREAGSLYGDVLDGFAKTHLKLGKTAQEILKTTQEAARKKVQDILRAGRTNPGTGETAPSLSRAEIALWMLAAYEPASAVLQWSRISADERKSQTAIPAELCGELDAEMDRVNEVPALAMRLAARLGLDKLEPVDDFEELDDLAEFMDQMEKEFQGNPLLDGASKAPIYAEGKAKLDEGLTKGDLLPYYAFLNSAGYAAADVDAQWGVFLRTHLPGRTDRGRLGMWENRNLKIAARVRSVAARHPGSRILVIYGAAHKPFLDAYLSLASDIELVQLESLIKSSETGQGKLPLPAKLERSAAAPNPKKG